MPRPIEFITLNATIAHTTSKAAQLVYLDDDENERKEWFPLSQLRDLDVDDPNEQTIQVAEWIGKQKGLGG